MTSGPRTLVCLLIAALALTAAGCGGDDEIPEREKLPPDITQELRRQMESIGDRVAAGVSGACDDIYSESDGNITPINAALASIPPRVDPRIRAALEESVQNLEQLVSEECDAIRREETGEETTPTETTPTETETVPSTETTTTPTTPETTPTTPQAPPETTPADPPETTPTTPAGEGGGAEAPGDGP